MHLDWRAGRNQSWSIVQGRKKRMIRTVIVLMDAESGLRSKLDVLGARGGGYCVVCETDYELRVSPCGHVCCKACWSDWLEKSETCPMCRRAVSARELRVCSLATWEMVGPMSCRFEKRLSQMTCLSCIGSATT
mmetsp:Transcript_986/g.2496  ORF Transcript_986/g.2496 Transcript_986/m.2496 type:complete len:134 (+) Transcript_986:222-623(+)